MTSRLPGWLLFLGSAILAGCNTGATPAPIIIGHVSDKTRLDKAGDQAELGIRLALHNLSKNDALATEFGGRKIEVRHTDTRGNLDALEAQAVRLDAVNRCLALVGGFSVSETLALNHAKVPLLTLQGQPAPGATQQVFYLGMSPARQGEVLAKHLAENSKVNRVTLLVHDKRLEAITFSESFQKTLADARKQDKKGAIVVNMLRFGEDAKSQPRPADESKWRDVIERMIGQKPHAVVFAGSVQGFNAWHNVLRNEHPDANPQIVFAGSDGEHRLFELAGDDKTSVLLATAFCPDPASEKIRAFLKEYHDAFHVDADVHSVMAYDGFRILIDAMKRCGSTPTPEKLRDELANIKDFPGLTGPLSFTAGRQLSRPIFVAQWNNGSLKLLKAIDVEKAKP